MQTALECGDFSPLFRGSRFAGIAITQKRRQVAALQRENPMTHPIIGIPAETVEQAPSQLSDGWIVGQRYLQPLLEVRDRSARSLASRLILNTIRQRSYQYHQPATSPKSRMSSTRDRGRELDSLGKHRRSDSKSQLVASLSQFRRSNYGGAQSLRHSRLGTQQGG